MLLSNIKINKLGLSCYIFVFAVLFAEYTFLICNNSEISTFFGWQLFLVWIFCVVKAYKRDGLFSLFTLVLLTTYLFLYSQVFSCLLIGSDKYKTIDGLVSYVYSEQTMQKVFIYHTLFLITLDFAFSIACKSVLLNKDKILRYDLTRERIGVLVLNVFFIVAFYRAYIEMKALMDNRLLFFIEGNAGALGIPLIVRLGSSCFKVGYLILLSSCPRKKIFIKYSILYFSMLIPGLAIGNRMELAVLVIFMLWYSSKFYNLKLATTKIIIGGFIALVVLQMIAFSRESKDASALGFMDIVSIFFQSQATSFHVLPLLIDYIAQINFPYPAVLDSLISGLLSSSGQSEEVLHLRSSLGHQLVYVVNPDYYLMGASLGTSYVAEVAQFGFWGVFFGGGFLAFYLRKFEVLILTNRYVRMFVYMVFAGIITSPRGSLLPSIYIISRDLLFFFFLYNLFRWYITRKTMNKLTK